MDASDEQGAAEVQDEPTPAPYPVLPQVDRGCDHAQMSSGHIRVMETAAQRTSALVDAVLSDPVCAHLRARSPRVGLSEWWLTGGAVLQNVWNAVEGRTKVAEDAARWPDLTSRTMVVNPWQQDPTCPGPIWTGSRQDVPWITWRQDARCGQPVGEVLVAAS